MISLLGLLLCALVVQFSSQVNSIPVQCVFVSPSLYVDYTDVVLLVATLGILFTIYAKRIMTLFSDDPDWTISFWLVQICIQCFVRIGYLEPVDASDRTKSSLNLIERGKIIRTEREKKRFQEHECIRMNSSNRFRSYTAAFVFITVELRRGFVGQITTLLATFTYGLGQIFVMRSSTPFQGISGSQNTMAFGQILPLLLLLLPCFTVLELYSGE